MAEELTHHLGDAKGVAPEEVDDQRNGYSTQTVIGESGAVEIEVPRDRRGFRSTIDRQRAEEL